MLHCCSGESFADVTGNSRPIFGDTILHFRRNIGENKSEIQTGVISHVDFASSWSGGLMDTLTYKKPG